jgi:hypothetical protein
VAEGLYADLVSGNDRLIERKDEQLQEAETPVLAKDRQVRQAEAQKAGLRSALDQAEAELARIKSSRSCRLVSRLNRLRGLAAGYLLGVGPGRRKRLTAQATCRTDRKACRPSSAIALCGCSDGVGFGDKLPVSSHALGRRHSLADDVVSGLGRTCKCRSISK